MARYRPTGPITPPTDLIPLADHWWSKIKALVELGILRKSGVMCPNDTLELWTTAPEAYPGASFDGTEPRRKIDTYFGICGNGHIWDL